MRMLVQQIRNPQIKRLSPQKEHSVQRLKSLRWYTVDFIVIVIEWMHDLPVICSVTMHTCMRSYPFSVYSFQRVSPDHFGMLQLFFLWMWYSVQMPHLSLLSGLGGLIWCFCFPGSHWRKRASSSPSRGERSRPSVSRRGSRCGPSTLKGLYWACSRLPAWPPNRN